MKVLMINGSPQSGGQHRHCTCRRWRQVFEQEGIEVRDRVQIGNQAIRGCVACG